MIGTSCSLGQSLNFTINGLTQVIERHLIGYALFDSDRVKGTQARPTRWTVDKGRARIVIGCPSSKGQGCANAAVGMSAQSRPDALFAVDGLHANVAHCFDMIHA